MFSGLRVIQLAPLLTGVSAVPTILRVLWGEGDSGGLRAPSGSDFRGPRTFALAPRLTFPACCPCWRGDRGAVQRGGQSLGSGPHRPGRCDVAGCGPGRPLTLSELWGSLRPRHRGARVTRGVTQPWAKTWEQLAAAKPGLLGPPGRVPRCPGSERGQSANPASRGVAETSVPRPPALRGGRTRTSPGPRRDVAPWSTAILFIPRGGASNADRSRSTRVTSGTSATRRGPLATLGLPYGGP